MNSTQNLASSIHIHTSEKKNLEREPESKQVGGSTAEETIMHPPQYVQEKEESGVLLPRMANTVLESAEQAHNKHNILSELAYAKHVLWNRVSTVLCIRFMKKIPSKHSKRENFTDLEQFACVQHQW